MIKTEVGGIPWNTLRPEIIADRITSPLIRGASGHLLRYDAGKYVEKGKSRVQLEVRDAYNPFIGLRATVGVVDKDLTLHFRTKGYDGDPDRRHPDLYAAKFVGEALQIFEERWGIVPTHFRGHWEHGQSRSDNLDLFNKYYALSHGDSVLAAKNTWSGRVMGDHCFNDITGNDITIYGSRGVPYRVEYAFWRQGKRPLQQAA